MTDPTESHVNRAGDTISIFMEAAFADVPTRIPLLPVPGVYPHPTYGEVDLSQGVIDSLVANFQREVYPQNLPVDCEHSKDSGAAGWIKSLHRNDDGSVDASVEWNAMGKQLLSEDRFRYISPAFRTEWTNPATRETHRNVLIGAGLTTHPYFKPGSLRPLITASEPVTDRKEHIDMADEQLTKPEAEREGTRIVEQSFAEQIVERDRKIADLERQFSESETARTTLAETVEKMRSEQQERAFREEVEGRSRDNTARYLGDLDKHIDILKALPDDKRADYMEIQRNQAKAARAFAERPERGSDAFGDTDPDGKIDAKTKEIQAAEPTLTIYQARAKAMQQVYSENPAAYKALRAN